MKRIATQKGFMSFVIFVLILISFFLSLRLSAQESKGFIMLGGGIMNDVDQKVQSNWVPTSEFKLGIKVDNKKDIGIGIVGELSKTPTMNLGVTIFSDHSSSPLLSADAGAVLYNDNIIKGTFDWKVGAGWISKPSKVRFYIKIQFAQRNFAFDGIKGTDQSNEFQGMIGFKF